MIVYWYFLFVLLSITGVVMSPNVFDRPFCVLELVLLLLFGGAFMRHKIKRNGLICFDTFFMPSYMLMNYAHSVFIYPDDQFLPAFLFATRSEMIPYAISLAQLGIALYMLASIMFERKEPVQRNVKVDIPPMLVNRSAFLSVFASLGVFAFVFLTNKVQEFTHIYPRLMALIMSLIALSWFYQAQHLEEGERGIVVLLKKNKMNMIATALFASSLLYVGSRSDVIFLLFIVLMLVNGYYQTVKFKVLLPMMVVGLVLMGFLMITRVSNYSLLDVSLVDSVSYGFKTITESPNILWMLLTDFVVNAKTLYESVDYVNVNGYLYGITYIPYLFIFLPMGGSFFTTFLTGLPIDEINSGVILSYFSGSTYGLGTNLIGDLYVNLSIVGVCVVMFLLGTLITRLEFPHTKYQFYLYLSFFANCAFIVRSDMFCWLNLFVFFVIFDWLLRIHVNVDEPEDALNEQTTS